MIVWFIFVILIPFAMNKKCQPDNANFDCQNNGLTEVPYLPLVVANQVTKMNLTSNNIQILHEDTFKYYTNLTELILDDNRLQKITENALSGLSKLTVLSLRNNILVIQPECLSQKALKNLNKLQKLDMSENPLGVIKNHFFKPLTNLRELYIEKAVKGLIIENDAFEGLNNLEILSLAHNDFETLPDYLEESLKKMILRQFILHGNTWRCDCHLRWIKNVLRDIIKRTQNNEYTKSNRPRCTDPSQFKEMELQMLDENEYQCKPKLFTNGRTITARQNSNISLVCNVYSNPISKVSWFKDDVLIQGHWHGIVLWNSNKQENNSTLIIEEAEHGFDDGVYRCEVGNILGKVSTNFTVKIIPHLMSKRVHINQILILIGIGASVLIILIGIIGVVMYIFLGQKSNHCSDENETQREISRGRTRTPKTLPIDNSEAVENIHFLENRGERPLTTSMQSQCLPDINSLFASTIVTPDDNNKDVQYISQLLSNYSTLCPLYPTNPSQCDPSNNSCPLHGNTPMLSKQCLLNCSPLIFCTNSHIKTDTSPPLHYSNSNLFNCTNDLNNSLMGNLDAFYSLERHIKMPKTDNDVSVSMGKSTINR